MIYLTHFLLGVLFAASGFLVRSACDHRGLLPHPMQQIGLTLLLCAIETAVVVPVVG